MKTPTVVFIVIMVAVLLIGTYFIVKANKPETIVKSSNGAEPTANIWTIVGGIMDIFKKEEEPEDPQPGDLGPGDMGPPVPEDY